MKGKHGRNVATLTSLGKAFHSDAIDTATDR